MIPGRSFEQTSQRLRSSSYEKSIEPTFRAPLFDLGEDAPSLNLIYQPEKVVFPFSNDECSAPYFEQLQVRTETAEYQEATNRVAIVIGESGLAANLRFIPEETIVVLNDSSDMCDFMKDYVKGLRTLQSPQEWSRYILERGPKSGRLELANQILEWATAKYSHPATNNEAFEIAKAKAKEKVIIPWRADITDFLQMERLGDALKSRDATVTMMNLTNVLPFIDNLENAWQCAALFSALPLSREAPILTTSLGPENKNPTNADLVEGLRPNIQTGPFFGRDNLGSGKGNDRYPLGAIETRQPIDDADDNLAWERMLLREALDGLRAATIKYRQQGRLLKPENGLDDGN